MSTPWFGGGLGGGLGRSGRSPEVREVDLGGRIWKALCSDSWVWRRSGEEVCGGQGGGSGRWIWEAVCSDSWVWRRSGEEVWGGQGGGSGRPYVAAGGGLGGGVWEAVCSDSWVWWSGGGSGRWSGTGRPYVAIPGFKGGLGRGPVRRSDEAKAKTKIKRPELWLNRLTRE